jgi:DNA-binding GntR family transcriptional regulator
MPPQADAATLNVQPQQRREVYERLSQLSEPMSVKQLLEETGIPETQLRDALRKLDAAGLAQRVKGAWSAVPLA